MSEKTALILLHDGVEEMEVVAPIDILRRGGIAVTVAAVGKSLQVRGRSGIVLGADALLADAAQANGDGDPYDLLVLPGGPGVAALRKDPQVRQVIERHAAANAILGAICAAPLLLLDTGFIENGNTTPYTAHPSTAAELPAASTTAAVITSYADGKTGTAAGGGNAGCAAPLIITSRGAGTATAFALSLLEHTIGGERGRETARKVAESICLHTAQ